MTESERELLIMVASLLLSKDKITGEDRSDLQGLLNKVSRQFRKTEAVKDASREVDRLRGRV